MNKNILKASLCSVAVIAGIPASFTYAEEASEDFIFEEIIVTATRRAESMQDIPVSVAALTGAMIERAGLTDTQEVLAVIPNVSFTRDRGLAVGANIAIRGMGTAVARVDQPVAVYVDDVYLSNESMFNMNMADLARVEVLRGPQSTLYGRNAMGGLVHFISKTPEMNEFSAFIDGTYGNYDHFSVKSMVNIPVVDEKLAVRANLTRSRRDSVVKGTVDTRDLDDQDNIGGRLQVEAALSDTMTLNLSGDYSKDDIRTFAFVPLSTAADHEANYLKAFGNDREVYGGSAKLSIDFETFQFLSITGLRYLDTEFEPGSCFTPGDECDQFFTQNSDQISQEFRFVSTTEGSLRWVGGLYYLKEERMQESGLFFGDYAQFFSFAFGDPTGSLIPRGTREASAAELVTKSYSVFGEFTYDVSEAFSITAGGRYLEETKAMDYEHTNDTMPFGPDFGVYAPIQNIVLEDTFNAFLPKLTLAYDINEDAMVYVTVSKGYKGAGFNAEFLGGVVDSTPSTPVTEDDLLSTYRFLPESVWNYEAGFKSEWLNGRATLNGAAFYMDWKNQQLLTGDSVATVTENIPTSTIYGFELEGRIQPSANLDIGFGFGWVDATFGDGAVINLAGLGLLDISDDRQPNVAKLTMSTYVQYTVELSEDMTMPLRADYSYRSGMHHSLGTDNVVFDGVKDIDFSNLHQSGYGLLNLRAGVQKGNFSIHVWVKNVLGEDYITSGAYDTGAAFLNNFIPGYPAVADEFVVSVGDPRTYGISARFEFQNSAIS